jgi:hypothetical protein
MFLVLTLGFSPFRGWSLSICDICTFPSELAEFSSASSDGKVQISQMMSKCFFFILMPGQIMQECFGLAYTDLAIKTFRQGQKQSK